MIENLDNKEIVSFDLDGTLAPSKSFLDPEMASLVMRLLEKKKVVVISGGSYNQFLSQFLKSLPEKSESFSNLILMPTSGTRMYVWSGSDWVEKYAELLTAEEKENILQALDEALEKGGYVKPEKVYGELIEDRGSQITFSALGQQAPVELKSVWDPDRKKREPVAKILIEMLPEFNIGVNAHTSIDITRKGVDKGYAIDKLVEMLDVPVSKMVFVGDALFEGGNDYPVRRTGIDVAPVSGPEETKKLIQGWLT